MSRTVAIVAACLALAVLAAAAWGVGGRAFGHTEDHVQTVDGPVWRIVVRGNAGDVRLLATGDRLPAGRVTATSDSGDVVLR